MDLSIFVAKTLAITYLSAGLGMLISQDVYKKMLPNFLKQREVMYLGGLFALVIGMILVENHNIWDGTWVMLVSLVGWIALLKGVMILALPKSLDWFKPLLKGENMTIMGMLVVIIGLVFAYFGFVL